MKIGAKRFLSLMLCCIMVLGLFPAMAFAATAGETVEIPFEKAWNDNNASEKRPNSITVSLYRVVNGEDELIESVAVTAPTDWKYVFRVGKDKVVDTNGNPFKLKVDEGSVAGYKETAHTDPVVTYSSFLVNKLNKITPCSELVIKQPTGETIKIVIAKKGNGLTIWTIDELSSDEKNIIKGYANKLEGIGNPKTYEFFFGLNNEKNGMKVTDTTINFGHKNDWSLLAVGSYDRNVIEVSRASITNTIIPDPDKINIDVTKNWVDGDNQDGLRPTSVTVQLMVVDEDGVKREVVGKTLTLSKEQNWTGTFTNLPKKDGNNTIIYSVDEVSVPDGYSKEEIEGNATEGFTITNTHIPETVTISGIKTWVGDNEEDRPGSITINLMNGATLIESKDVSADSADSWEWSFTVPKYEGGVAINYTVEEVVPEGYTSEVKQGPNGGFTITNTYTATSTSESKPESKPIRDTVTIEIGNNEKTEEANPDTGAPLMFAPVMVAALAAAVVVKRKK